MSDEPIYKDSKYQDLKWSKSEMRQEHESMCKFRRNKRRELLKSANRKRMNELTKIKSQNRLFTDRRSKFTTTKLFMYIILFNCMTIEVYSMWVMYKLSDLSALYSLIGAVIGESLSFAIYCAKSFNDTKEEAKSKLERDKFEASFKDENHNGIPDDEEDDYIPDEEIEISE